MSIDLIKEGIGTMVSKINWVSLKIHNYTQKCLQELGLAHCLYFLIFLFKKEKKIVMLFTWKMVMNNQFHTCGTFYVNLRSIFILPIYFTSIHQLFYFYSRLSANKKKSLLLQPGFSRHSRSNSVDTLNDGPLEASRYDSKMGTSMFSSAKKPMQRSKSQANLMTPCTPKNVYRPPSMALDSAKSVR